MEMDRKSWIKRIGTGAGVVLVVLAIYFAFREFDWHHLQQAQPWQWGVMIAAVTTNLLLGGMTFWLVTLSFDTKPPVSLRKMTLLVAATALANYLPLRPGIVGRAAYLKLRHEAPVTQSMIVLIIITVLGSIMSIGSAALVLLSSHTNKNALPWLMIMGLAILVFFVGPIAKKMLQRKLVAPWGWPILRALDLLVASLRLWTAFAIIGQPVTIEIAILTGSAGLLISLIGLTPNGLGMEEWTIAALTAATASTLPNPAAAGLAAALVDRAFEALVVIPAGFYAWHRLLRIDAAAKTASQN